MKDNKKTSETLRVDDFMRVKSRIDFKQYGLIQVILLPILLPISTVYEMMRPFIKAFRSSNTLDSDRMSITSIDSGTSRSSSDYTASTEILIDSPLDTLVAELKTSTCLYKKPILDILLPAMDDNEGKIEITPEGRLAASKQKLGDLPGIGDFGLFSLSDILPYVYSVNPNATIAPPFEAKYLTPIKEKNAEDIIALLTDDYGKDVDIESVKGKIQDHQLGHPDILLSIMHNGMGKGEHGVSDKGKKEAVNHMTRILLQKPEMLSECKLNFRELLVGLALLYSQPPSTEENNEVTPGKPRI